LNLAINARDAMPEGGKLTMETSSVRLDADYAARNIDVTSGDYVLLAVSDTGVGIPPDVLERVFEPFFTTKEPGKGTGLGLSMVYGFIKQSNGHIKIYSEIGRGTVVKIYLPRARTVEAAKMVREQEPEASRGHELVLVVEDNADMRAVAAAQLTDLGYRVLEADSAKAALAILEKRRDIDLLFSDVIMPGGMSGFELVVEARAKYPKLKMLLASGYTAKTITTGIIDLGGTELLNKPYRKYDLAIKLRQVLA
jgi:CheY-like chemotaxis protein